jgi:cell division septal protein FtsQ
VAVKRKNSAVKNRRHKLSVLYFVLTVSGLAVLGMLANNWTKSSKDIDITVTGTAFTTIKKVLTLAAIPDTASISDLDLLLIKKNILKNPYIKDVTLTTASPNVLKIQVAERTPFAHLINYYTKDWLLDEDGIVLPSFYGYCSNNMPAITGASSKGKPMKNGTEVNNTKVLKALSVLKKINQYSESLYNRVSELSVVNKRDMLIYTTEYGMPIVFGNDTELDAKVQLMYSFLFQHNGTQNTADMAYIDLRYKNQVVVRYAGDESFAVNLDETDVTTIPTQENTQ